MRVCGVEVRLCGRVGCGVRVWGEGLEVWSVKVRVYGGVG